MNQLALPLAAAAENELDLDSYDRVLIMSSGGKDSIACLLYILGRGVDPARIEMWHHSIDGREGSSLMDWPVTEDYCRKVALSFGLPLYFSWRHHGFEGEMLRDNAPTAPVSTETPDGVVLTAGGNGPLGTRRKFPQVSASLQTRWCSSALKIDASSMAITMQSRFEGKRTLLVTGERAEESAARSRYAVFQPHKTSNGKRCVDQYRPVLHWNEAEVWAILRRWGVVPHVAYRLGFSRTSCQFCIFGNQDVLATNRKIDPVRFERIAAYEREFKVTIRRDGDINAAADRGTPFETDEAAVALALSPIHYEPVRVDPSEWRLPSGAFKRHGGPT